MQAAGTKIPLIQQFVGNYNIKRGVLSNSYDEPTYLGFWVEFDLNPIDTASGNYDALPQGLFADNSNTYSAEKYLKNIGLSKKSENIKKFKELLNDISTLTPWTISEITGLSDLLKIDPTKNIINEDNRIKLSFTESLDMRSSVMFDLYKRAVYDYTYKRYLLPDIMRYFSMNIYVAEIRPFHKPRNTRTDSIDESDFKLSENSFDFNNVLGNQYSTNTTHDNKTYTGNYFLETLDDHISIIKYEFWNCEFVLESIGKSWVETMTNSEGTSDNKIEVEIKVGGINETPSYSILEKALQISSTNFDSKRTDKYYNNSEGSRTDASELIKKLHRDENPDSVYGRGPYKEGHLRNSDDVIDNTLGEKLLDGLESMTKAEIRNQVNSSIDGLTLGNVYGLSPSRILDNLENPQGIITGMRDVLGNLTNEASAELIMENIYEFFGTEEEKLDEINENIDLDGNGNPGDIDENIDLDGNDNPGDIDENIDLDGNDISDNIDESADLEGNDISDNIDDNIELKGESLSDDLNENIELDGNESLDDLNENIELDGNESLDDINDNIELKGENLSDNIDGNIELKGESLSDILNGNIELDGNEGLDDIDENVELEGESLSGSIDDNIELKGESLADILNGNVELDGNESLDDIDENVELKGEDLSGNVDDNIELKGESLSDILNGNVVLEGNEGLDDIDENVEFENEVKNISIDENINLDGESLSDNIDENVELEGESLSVSIDDNIELKGESLSDILNGNVVLEGNMDLDDIDENVEFENEVKNISIDDNINLEGEKLSDSIDENVEFEDGKFSDDLNGNIEFEDNDKDKEIDKNVEFEDGKFSDNIDDNIELSGSKNSTNIEENVNITGSTKVNELSNEDLIKEKMKKFIRDKNKNDNENCEDC